jgi:hypothetical protein
MPMKPSLTGVVSAPRDVDSASVPWEIARLAAAEQLRKRRRLSAIGGIDVLAFLVPPTLAARSGVLPLDSSSF